MNRITRLAGVAALGLAVAACGKGGGADDANLSDADNMLVPADEGAPVAGEDGNVTDAGNASTDTAGNMGEGNAR